MRGRICEICLTTVKGEQWGVVPITVGAIDNDWIDVESGVSFLVHRYCMDEAIACYTMELADGFLENEYMLERKNVDK
tara:strand:- start:2422 stop:2655 length:234 start_codon:yes stop_codon:yes gene_type:complete